MTITAPERATLGYGLDPDEGEAFWLLGGMLETIKIGGADTDGQFGLLEIVVRAGDGSPWHVHPEEDEWFYVLEGDSPSTSETVDSTYLQAGSPLAPRGSRTHLFAGPAGGKALVGFAPFQFEGFLRAIGEPAPERVLPPPLQAPPDMAHIVPIGIKNGIEILGPPGPPPGR